MYLKDMFVKPIDRDLSGVLKAGQLSDKDVRQELEEYVVTRELQRHFAEFFANYKKGIHGDTDKMGVWISGFFGSGKSHFLKILSYLLANRMVDGKSAIDYFVDDNKISDPAVLADMKLAASVSTDVILFNIDSKSSGRDRQNNKESILSAFLKVFNQQLGFYGANPYIADLERNLVEEGQYQAFQDAFANICGKSWLESRHRVRFTQDTICEALVAIGYMSLEAAQNVCRSFTNETYDMDISDFSTLVARYIEHKGDQHHVVFLVDEMGQYITDRENNGLMLNLQTITEELGLACHGKAWVIVTGQQDIDSIVAQVNRDQLSKIQGRFDTRLSLSSANVDEIIRKRILDKTEVATQTLALFYDEMEIKIENLIEFNDKIEKKMYSSRTDFAQTYPFIPYQFHLLGDSLTAIRTHGASGKNLSDGARSMLAFCKEAAVKQKDAQEGVFIPFYMFYDSLGQLLDDAHSSVIVRAYDNTYINPEQSKECFAVDVLKTLFMIKYVKEIIANVKNITSLMVRDIHEDRYTLTAQVEDALRILVRQTLVQKVGEEYVFLTNEEQEINREIEGQQVESSELTNKIAEMIFEGLYEDNKYRYPAFSGRYTFAFNQSVDGRPFKNGQTHDIALKILTPNYSDTVVDEKSLRLMSSQERSVIVMLPSDNAFSDELRTALKIEKYLRLNTPNVVPKHEEIKAAKKSEMREHNTNARIYLEQSLKAADIYVNGDKVQIASKDIKSRINEAMGKLVATVFHKLSYITEPMSEASVKGVLLGTKDAQISMISSGDTPNKLAIADVLEFIATASSRHVKTSLKSIMERFTKSPYGFIENDVQWIVAKLFKEGNINLILNSETITLLSKSEDEIYRYLTRKEFLEKLLTDKREKATDRQKKAMREVVHELFNTSFANEEDDAMLKTFTTLMTRLKDELGKYEALYLPENAYPGYEIVKNGKALAWNMLQVSNTAEGFRAVDKKYEDLLEFAEDYEPIKTFFEGDQRTIWDSCRKSLNIFNQSETLISNAEILMVVSDMYGIMQRKEPYREIRSLPALHDRFKRIYVDLLSEAEGPVQSSIDAAWARVSQELAGKLCASALGSKIGEGFQALKEKAVTCNNLTILYSISKEADTLKIRYLNTIDAEEKRLLQEQADQQAKADAEKARVTGAPIPTPAAPAPMPKPIAQRTISIKQINIEPTWRIKTTQDVDHYVEALRQKLNAELNDEVVLNVEF